MALGAFALPFTPAGAASGAAPRLAVVALHDASLGAVTESGVRDRFGEALTRATGVARVSQADLEAGLVDQVERSRHQTLARAAETRRRGEALDKKLELDKAVAALGEARDQMQAALASQADGALPEVLVELGQAELRLGRVEAARDAFKQARSAGAGEEPPPSLDHQAREAWVEAMGSLHGLANSGLDLSTEPVGAQLFLDGRPAGRAPLLLRGLFEGTHLVRAELPGHRARVTTVTLAVSQTLPVHLVLPGEPPPVIEATGSVEEIFEGALRMGRALEVDYEVDYLAVVGFAHQGEERPLTWMVVDVRRGRTVLVGSSSASPQDPSAGSAAGIAAGERLSAYLKAVPALPTASALQLE